LKKKNKWKKIIFDGRGKPMENDLTSSFKDRRKERMKDPVYKQASLDARIELLEKENKKFKRALKFYADKENWERVRLGKEAIEISSSIEDDQGKKARKALGIHD
jgi:hypothetical protein